MVATSHWLSSKFITSKLDCGTDDRWCDAHKEFLKTSQYPNSLPFLLHETIFSSLPAKEAILYARENLMPFVATHSVLPLLASALYRNNQSEAGAGTEIPSWKFENLSVLFREEFCRLHGWPAEDPLEVVVDLGSRGGALNAVEKARKVIGQRLGDVRSWDELPVRFSLLPLLRSNLILMIRWKSLFLLLDDIIPSLSALLPRNKQLKIIHQ
jgi:hypothetical protein